MLQFNVKPFLVPSLQLDVDLFLKSCKLRRTDR